MNNLKVNKYKFQDIKQYEDEIEYWKNIPSEEKLSILQELREQYISLFNIGTKLMVSVKKI